MNQADYEKIESARQRVVAAVRDSGWDEVAQSLSAMLWTLAEVRPDFEELPSWIAEAKSSGAFDAQGDRGAAVSEKAYSILRSVVKR